MAPAPETHDARAPGAVPVDLDYGAFAAELDALRQRLEVAHGHEARAHLRRQAFWGRVCSVLGYATAWFPNPLAAVLISLGMTARWTIVAHHTRHRALDRTPGVPERETSRGFASGHRRWVDWLDWLDPVCWDHEHNQLHHSYTGEAADPDLVEAQLERMRVHPAPRWFKLLVVGFFALTWKFTYYAPNLFTLHLRETRRRAAGRSFDRTESQANVDLLRAWSPFHADGAAFWRRVVLPYVLLRFVALPSLFLPLGTTAALWVLVSSLAAELLTNLHTFVIVVPNHAGDDLYRFDRPGTDRAEFYVRQITGTVNFRTGGAVTDFLHGFLNYQIEHHLWPNLAPRVYQAAAPEVRRLCASHGVPYVQESVFLRVLKVLDIMTGRASMRRGETLGRDARFSESGPGHPRPRAQPPHRPALP
jgi:fatty acid desaturase